MSSSLRPPGDGPRLQQMAALAVRQQRSSARLAAGRRIATAADDPAGLAIASRLAATERSLGQGQRNVADGQGLARIADGALQGSQDSLSRMRELSVQSRNGTTSPADREAIQQEYDQLAAQLDQAAGSTSYGGSSLLDGTAGGSEAISITDGAGGATELDLPDASAQALGVAGRPVDDPATIAALDAAGGQLAAFRAQLGAADNAFGRQGARLGAASEAAAAARSRIEDSDVASDVAERVRDRILLGMQVAGQRQAGAAPGRLLDLIG